MNKSSLGRQGTLEVARGRDFYQCYILILLFGCCTIFYYFGELVDFAGWEALAWGFFYGVHDVHRLLFLAPIIYAGYVFGVKATIIIMIITTMTFLPRALFITQFHDPLLRTVLFAVIAGALGYLTAITRRESERCNRLEALLTSERDTMLGVLERMEERVLIIDPDYRIRFMNPSMMRDFGEGIGSHCYKYLHKSDAPCRQICKLPAIINGAIEKWESEFPGGRTYEVLASPYADSDGVVCQLAIFRNTTQHEKG